MRAGRSKRGPPPPPGGAAGGAGGGARGGGGGGGRNAFVSGLAWAFMTGRGPQVAVEHGVAHGALAMTTPGDNAATSLAEVEAVIRGKGAAAIR